MTEKESGVRFGGPRCYLQAGPSGGFGSPAWKT